MPTPIRTSVLAAVFVATTLVGAGFHYQLFSAALVVNTNTQAINAQNKLNNTANALSGVFQRISSGLRINRAADDAAGLGVSESMDTAVRALEQGMRNTGDAISLITASEGAAQKLGNIIKRMRELAVQSASETLAADEREYVDDEFEQLLPADYTSSLEELSAAIDALTVQIAESDGGAATGEAGERFLGRLAAVQEDIENAVFDAEESEDAALLLEQIETSEEDLTNARKEVIRVTETIARDADKARKAAEGFLRKAEMRRAAAPARMQKSSRSARTSAGRM